MVRTCVSTRGRRARHPSRIVPVGRIDADTTGALLLTNDGELAHSLAHPSHEIDKVYLRRGGEGRPMVQLFNELGNETRLAWAADPLPIAYRKRLAALIY